MGEGAGRGQCGRKGPVAIVGPTASSKTKAAYELAKRIGAEIISADSMAVYRGLDIGTAKPGRKERAEVPFHMIDLVDPDEPFTVADFQERAVKVIDEVLARRQVPLLVGGTGLYVRAAIDGLNIPGRGADAELRARLSRLADEKGNAYLHAELARVDAAAAARIHPNNRKRIIRAIEVYKQTGVPMSVAAERTKPAAPRYPDAIQFGLTLDRATLYRRIEERVDEQIRAGLVEEVKALLDKAYDVGLPALQGLGYKEIAAYLKGRCDLQTAVSVMKRNTRRFAKRQYTWFRADPRVEWIEVDSLSPSEVAEVLEAKLRRAQVLGQDVGGPV